MMQSQAAAGAEGGLNTVHNSMAPHYTGMAAGSMLNGGTAQASAGA